MFAVPVLAGLAAYLALAFPIYAVFYTIEPYDSGTGNGLTAYRLLLSLAYVTHYLSSLGVSFLFARSVRTPVAAVFVIVMPVLLVLGVPTLWFIAFYGCENVPGPFPWGGITCN